MAIPIKPVVAKPTLGTSGGSEGRQDRTSDVAKRIRNQIRSGTGGPNTRKAIKRLRGMNKKKKPKFNATKFEAARKSAFGLTSAQA